MEILIYEWRGDINHSQRSVGHIQERKWNNLIEKVDLYIPRNREGRIRLQTIPDEMPGMPLQDIWDDIPPISSHAAERLGYPTQKPLALLERIIAASAATPATWCSTRSAAAAPPSPPPQKLGRRWIGIDITHLCDRPASKTASRAPSIGRPARLRWWSASRKTWLRAPDSPSDDRYQFQWWALSLVQAPAAGRQELGGKKGKKGSDKGIDGVINFIDDAKQQAEAGAGAGQGGARQQRHVRDLRGVDRARGGGDRRADHARAAQP